MHDFDIYVDDTRGALAAKRLRDSIAALTMKEHRRSKHPEQHLRFRVRRSTARHLYRGRRFAAGEIGLQLIACGRCATTLRRMLPCDPVYTGKILSLDCIYQFDGATVRGNSTDPGSPMGPFQAPTIAFSWNLPGNQLPYTYTTDDPSQLQAIVSSPTAGAGAGVLTWPKTNWLVTTYAPTAPFIVARNRKTCLLRRGKARRFQFSPAAVQR